MLIHKIEYYDEHNNVKSVDFDKFINDSRLEHLPYFQVLYINTRENKFIYRCNTNIDVNSKAWIGTKYLIDLHNNTLQCEADCAQKNVSTSVYDRKPNSSFTGNVYKIKHINYTRKEEI